LREKNGESRALGSTDICQRCHKPYAVEYPTQKYCRDCKPKKNAQVNEGLYRKICNYIVKELDRFGRAYLESGLYREMFRKAGVRFISLAEGHDSLKGDGDDFTPFREVINEFYLRQYSKKIKAAFRSRGMAGKHTSSYPPYGYLKSPDDKNQWIRLCVCSLNAL